MARRNLRPNTRQRKPQSLAISPDELISDISVEDELSRSYMEYALSVIVSRAIPDARDGLKPVQRRILYAMMEAGLRSDKPYRKSIAAVGDTMKKYHPHGDSAIYETLVRLAQSWVMNAKLVDGHGNFGSLDDGPAASRYTEARLSGHAELLLANVDENTVKMSPNFDATTSEPSVLPAAFPNLLVNGATGIAVGMATNIPPHNLAETIAACQLLLTNPKATLDDVLAILPAPDFPTGGQLVTTPEQIREAYATGRGAFRVRATVTITDVSARRRGIVVTELPYNVGPEKVIARVKELVSLKRLEGISDIKDLTDRKHGLRLVFEIKPGYSPEALLEEIYRTTPLEESFSLNAVALVDSRPVTCDLLTLLHCFINHRLDVIVKRSQFRLDKATKRAHILEGLLLALASIEDVIAIIRASKDADTARTKLCLSLNLDEEQATHILDMPLRRLTGLEAGKLRDELRELKTIVRYLNGILASPKKQRELVGAELAEVVAVPVARRTILAPLTPAALLSAASNTKKVAATTVKPTKLAEEPCTVTLLADGTLQKNGVLPSLASVTTNTHGTVIAIMSDGQALSVPVLELPESNVPLSTFGAVGTAQCVALLPLGAHFAIATTTGVVKRVAEDTPTAAQLERSGAQGLSVIALKTGDLVVGAAVCDDTSDIVFITKNGQLLRADARHVRPQGRAASGMAGIKLREKDTVTSFGAYPTTELFQVVTATDAGHGKITPLGDYPSQGRATSGVRCITLRAADTCISAAAVLPARSDVVALDNKGKPFKHEWVGGRRDATGQPMAKICAQIASKRVN